jgi:hypothetical protein
MNRTWKIIKEFPNYSVSQYGDIKRNDISTSKIPTLGTNTYLSINLYYNGKHKFRTVHRIVAEAFIPNPDNLPCVNHIDGDKTNNHYKNLEWCNHSNNMKHAYESGIRKPHNKWNNEKEVFQYDLEGEVLGNYPSVKEAAKQTGCNIKSIARVCRGERNKHGGFKWSY